MKKEMWMDLHLFDDPEPEPEPEPAKYIVLENCTVNINGVKTELKRNLIVNKSVTGAVVGVEVVDGGAEIDLDEGMIEMLIATGIIAEIEVPEEDADAEGT